VDELEKDLLDLISKWELFTKRLKSVEPAHKVLGEMDRASTILRDILTDEFTHIHVNDDALYDEVKSYVQEISPDLEKIVRLYRHKEPIFDHFGVEKQIDRKSTRLNFSHVKIAYAV